MIRESIDIHVHGAPDIAPRKMDDIQIAKKALKEGMTAIVLKAHSRSTASSANEINKKLGRDITYSSLVLNQFSEFDIDFVGNEIDKGIKIIYMPTVDFISQKSHDGLSIVKNDKLIEEISQILKLIAAKNLALATGHVTGNELMILLSEAKKIGIQKIIITHPDMEITKLDVELQKKLSKDGIYFDRTFYSCINPNFPYDEKYERISDNGQLYSQEKLKEIVENIRQTGVENNILTTDLGQPENLDPVTGFKFYLKKLKTLGIADEEINIMTKINPAKLLGLYDFFVNKYVQNTVSIQQKKLNTKYREPIVGFADAANPLFIELKRIVRGTHYLPKDLLDDAKTVISIFLPFSTDIIESNYRKGPTSKEWSVAYTETNQLLDRISMNLAEEFAKLWYSSLGIKTTHHLSHANKDNYDYDELLSDWSQRHIANICGIGTFGLNNMIITKKGCAGRLGSLIVSAPIKPDKPINEEYCLAKNGGNCYKCMENCLIQALSEYEFDRVKCMDYLITQRKYQEKVYELEEGTQTCGKCSTRIPCESKIPK